MKLNRDVLMKVGIAAAIVLIIYLLFRSRSCKDSFADYADYGAQDGAQDGGGVPDDEYAENMYEEQPADYAYGDDNADTDYTDGESPLLMESTLRDDQANAMFEPEL